MNNQGEVFIKCCISRKEAADAFRQTFTDMCKWKHAMLLVSCGTLSDFLAVRTTLAAEPDLKKQPQTTKATLPKAGSKSRPRPSWLGSNLCPRHNGCRRQDDQPGFFCEGRAEDKKVKTTKPNTL